MGRKKLTPEEKKAQRQTALEEMMTKQENTLAGQHAKLAELGLSDFSDLDNLPVEERLKAIEYVYGEEDMQFARPVKYRKSSSIKIKPTYKIYGHEFFDFVPPWFNKPVLKWKPSVGDTGYEASTFKTPVAEGTVLPNLFDILEKVNADGTDTLTDLDRELLERYQYDKYGRKIGSTLDTLKNLKRLGMEEDYRSRKFYNFVSKNPDFNFNINSKYNSNSVWSGTPYDRLKARMGLSYGNYNNIINETAGLNPTFEQRNIGLRYFEDAIRSKDFLANLANKGMLAYSPNAVERHESGNYLPRDFWFTNVGGEVPSAEGASNPTIPVDVALLETLEKGAKRSKDRNTQNVISFKKEPSVDFSEFYKYLESLPQEVQQKIIDAGKENEAINAQRNAAAQAKSKSQRGFVNPVTALTGAVVSPLLLSATMASPNFGSSLAKGTAETAGAITGLVSSIPILGDYLLNSAYEKMDRDVVTPVTRALKGAYERKTNGYMHPEYGGSYMDIDLNNIQPMDISKFELKD